MADWLLVNDEYEKGIKKMSWAGQGDMIDATTAPAAPLAVLAPTCISSTQTSLVLQWTEPPNNGSAISAYRLEMCVDLNDGFHVVYKGNGHISYGILVIGTY